MSRRRSRDRRMNYMRDRAERKSYRKRDRMHAPMDYNYDYPEYRVSYDATSGRNRYHNEGRYMGYEQPYESRRAYDYNYDMRNDYRRSRDYADDDMDEEYHDDLMHWIKDLQKYDRFGLSKEQVIQKAKEMNVEFEEYDEDEFYAIYLMHISDYPGIANDPRMYLSMAKSWLEDKDLEISPSEKVCKYLYEIVMAED